jgi:hypothetical protein
VKAVAWVGGVLAVAGFVVLAVAGITGATAILITAVALVAMIGLGGTMGGRHTPNVPPVRGGPPEDDEPGPRPVGEDVDGTDGASATP